MPVTTLSSSMGMKPVIVLACPGALSNFEYYHIYPDPEQRDLRLALQKYAGVGAERILLALGRMNDDLIANG